MTSTAYVTLRVREEDLSNGIFLRAGNEIVPGECEVTLHEDDFRAGVLVKGLRYGGKLIPHTWTEDAGDYRAVVHPSRQGVVDVDVEMYGGTREQYEHSRELQAAFCKVHGWTLGVYSHHAAAKR